MQCSKSLFSHPHYEFWKKILPVLGSEIRHGFPCIYMLGTEEGIGM